jgi:hypothetical protein
MSITHTVRSSWGGTNGAAVSGETAISSDSEANMSRAIAANQTNLALDFQFPTGAGRIRSVYLLASVAMTIKTNSSGSPQETLVLAAGQPVIWQYGSGATCPFAVTANITKFYVTNTTAGTLDARILYSET